MENPLYWNEVERLMFEVWKEHNQAMDDLVCGPSLFRMLFERLTEKGFLKPESEWPLIS